MEFLPSLDIPHLDESVPGLAGQPFAVGTKSHITAHATWLAVCQRCEREIVYHFSGLDVPHLDRTVFGGTSHEFAVWAERRTADSATILELAEFAAGHGIPHPNRWVFTRANQVS